MCLLKNLENFLLAQHQLHLPSKTHFLLMNLNFLALPKTVELDSAKNPSEKAAIAPLKSQASQGQASRLLG